MPGYACSESVSRNPGATSPKNEGMSSLIIFETKSHNVRYIEQNILYLCKIMNVMMSKGVVLLPVLKKILIGFGENIKLARLRRKLSAEQIAERAGISRGTLISIEKGSPTVSIGAYLQVLYILGLQNDFMKLANDDILGRKLQDAQLKVKKRAPKN